MVALEAAEEMAEVDERHDELALLVLDEDLDDTAEALEHVLALVSRQVLLLDVSRLDEARKPLSLVEVVEAVAQEGPLACRKEVRNSQ